MKLIQITSQHRRDVWMDLECENPECKAVEKKVSGYDDRNFWDNALPDKKCTKCGCSTNSLGLGAAPVETKYPDYLQV